MRCLAALEDRDGMAEVRRDRREASALADPDGMRAGPSLPLLCYGRRVAGDEHGGGPALARPPAQRDQKATSIRRDGRVRGAGAELERLKFLQRALGEDRSSPGGIHSDHPAASESV